MRSTTTWTIVSALVLFQQERRTPLRATNAKNSEEQTEHTTGTRQKMQTTTRPSNKRISRWWGNSATACSNCAEDDRAADGLREMRRGMQSDVVRASECRKLMDEIHRGVRGKRGRRAKDKIHSTESFKAAIRT